MNPRPRPHSGGLPALSLFLFAASTFLLAADGLPDPLWRKAIAVASTNADWVPGLVVMRSEVLRKGASQGVHEMWQRSTLDQKGEVVTQTVKILEDGKDVTEKEKPKNKATGAPRKKPGGPTGGNPFDPEVQDRILLKLAPSSRTIAGRDCVGYAFELKTGDGALAKGVAWLEKGTGIPAEIENMTLEPLPEKHLKRLAFTTRYGTTADGVWRVQTIETTGTVSVMFVTADIRSVMTFSEYWKKPRRETPSTP